MQLDKPSVLFFNEPSNLKLDILKIFKNFDAQIFTVVDLETLKSALNEQSFDLLICQSAKNINVLNDLFEKLSDELLSIITCLITPSQRNEVTKFDYHISEEHLKNHEFAEHYFSDIFYLAKKYKAKNELSAMLLHDLRSPTQSILGYLELLEKKVFGEINAGQLQILQNAINLGDNIIELMEALSLVHQFENKQFVPNSTKIHLKELIDQTLRSLWVQADKKNIKFVPQVANDLPDIIADSQGIQRVLNNLLNNAIKYSPENGTVRIMVKCTESGTKQQKLQVRIIDSGPGIPADQLNYIFDKYFRIRRDKGKIKGQGLGLYISRLIVEAHGGKIEAYNNREGGCTFYFSLSMPADTPSNKYRPDKHSNN